MLRLLNQGKAFTLARLAGSGLTVHLFCNDVVPGDFDQNASYQELVGGGYAPKALPLEGWTIIDGQMVYPRQDWLFTSTPNVPRVYGYFVSEAGGTILWAERGPAPFTVAAGGEYRVVPKFVLE